MGSAIVEISHDEHKFSRWILDLVRDRRYGISMMHRSQFARPPLYSDGELANRANLVMFEHPLTTQFGSWKAFEDALIFTSIIPSAFIRSLEHSGAKSALFDYSPVFFARLAMRSRSTINCFDHLLSEMTDSSARVPEDSRLTELHNQLTQYVAQEALASIYFHSDDREDATNDPRILRNPGEHQFFIIGVFNPIGPTVTSFEAFETSIENEYELASIQRHPLYPSCLPVARTQMTSADFQKILQKAVDREFNWLPTYLDLTGCPQELHSEIAEIIKKKLHQLASEYNIDVAKHTERLMQLNEDAWSRVGHDLPEIADATRPPTDHEIDNYFEVITSSWNLALFWNSISDAWDGSLIYNLKNNILGQTNVGPLIWTYNQRLLSD